MKKLLFLGYGGGHINALIPVIKQFYYLPDYEVCAIGINLAAEALRQNKIACKTLSDYLTEEALNIGRPLALKNHNFKSVVSYADSIAYYGFSMQDLINKVGSEMAHQILHIYDRRLFLPVESMKMILQKERPDVVVVTTMHRFEAASILAAKELGIPSVKIEDLVGNIIIPFPDKIQADTEEEYNHLIEKGFTPEQLVMKADLENSVIKGYRDSIHECYNSMRPDRECVISNYVRDNLITKGHKPENICVTGQPAFDILKDYEHIDKERYLLELGLECDKPVLSFMSQPLSNRLDILRNIIDGIRNIPDLQFIIKLHPNEDGNIQRLILDELKYKATIVKDIPAPVITQISTLTSTVSSTTGLEAACLDKDLIYFNFFNEYEVVPYADMGIGIRITKVDEIEKKVIELLNNTELRKKLADARKEYTNYGSAAKNIKVIIDELIGAGR